MRKAENATSATHHLRRSRRAWLLRVARRQPVVSEEEVIVQVHEAAAVQVGGGIGRVPDAGQRLVVGKIHGVGIIEITVGQEMRAGVEVRRQVRAKSARDREGPRQGGRRPRGEG